MRLFIGNTEVHLPPNTLSRLNSPSPELLMIVVTCKLTDCVYWKSPPSTTQLQDACACSHPDKAMYLKNETCPLYKKGWAGTNTKDLADRFRKKKL